MLQRLLIITLTLFSLTASAQWQQTGSKVRYVNGLGIPTKDTAAGVAADSSQILIRPADSSLYIKYKRTWIRVGGGGGSIGGSGTTNYIPKFTASGFIGNSQIFDNGTNVGIGTAIPTRKLTIQDAANSYMNFNATSFSNYTIGSDLHGFIVFDGTASAYRLAIKPSTGNVLVNTTTDNGVDKLQVSGSMNVSTLATTNNLSVTTNATVGGTARVSGTLIAGTTADNGADKLQVYGSSYYTGSMQQRITQPRFLLDDADNTGTASLWFRPTSASYNIRGALELISFGAAAGGELRMSAGASGGSPTSSQYQTFYTAGVERVRITSAGRVLANTTTDNGTDQLQVNGSIQGTGFDQAYLARTTTYTATTNDYFIDCTTGTFTVNLFTAVGNTGRILIIKNSGTGTITVDPNGSQTIDGATTQSLATQWSRVHIISDGANWKIISN